MNEIIKEIPMTNFFGLQSFDLVNIENELIINSININEPISEYEENKENWHFSEHGGTDSYGVKNSEAGKLLYETVKKILKEMFFATVYEEDHWIHAIKPGEQTLGHCHCLVGLSFLYFLNSPDNSGNLRFNHECPNYKFSCDFKPRSGCLLIFPSYLWHESDVNNSDEVRYTYCGNVNAPYYQQRSKFELVNDKNISI
jgi:hypothetical protein